MKIDPSQMKRGSGGSYSGNVTPTRFTFQTPELIYPLKITSISVKDHTEALLYIMAPKKVAIPGSGLEYAKRLKGDDIKRLKSGKVAIPQSAYASHEVQKHDFKNLRGWLKKGMFLTKVRRVYTKQEMNDDLRIKYAGNNTEHVTYPDCGGAPP